MPWSPPIERMHQYVAAALRPCGSASQAGTRLRFQGGLYRGTP